MRSGYLWVVLLCSAYFSYSDADTCSATMFAMDYYMTLIDLTNGKSGTSLSWYSTEISSNSILAFDIYHPGMLSVGVVGTQTGGWADLGSATDIQKKYGTELRNAYPTLHYDNTGRLAIQGKTKPETMVEVNPSDYSSIQQPTTANSFVPIVGHIYIISTFVDRQEYLVAKLFVQSYFNGTDIEDAYINFRWDVLTAPAGVDCPCMINPNQPAPYISSVSTISSYNNNNEDNGNNAVDAHTHNTIIVLTVFLVLVWVVVIGLVVVTVLNSLLIYLNARGGRRGYQRL